jgi:hypothetical protein
MRLQQERNCAFGQSVVPQFSPLLKYEKSAAPLLVCYENGQLWAS